MNLNSLFPINKFLMNALGLNKLPDKLIKEFLRNPKIFVALVDLILKNIIECIDEDTERQELADTLNEYINIPFIDEIVEQGIFEQTLETAHKALEKIRAILQAKKDTQRIQVKS